MKILKPLSILLLTVLSLSLTSCGDDDDGASTTVEASFQLEGENFTVSTRSAVLLNEILSIQLFDAGQAEGVIINIKNPDVGTYDLGPNGITDNNASFVLNNIGAYVSKVPGGSGEISITSFNTAEMTVSGTFQFVGLNGTGDTRTITNGEFTNLPYTEGVGGNGNNVLTADIDGTSLNANSVTAFSIEFQGITSISVSAINNSTFSNIGLTLPADIEVGTYDFDSFPLPGAIIGQYNIDLGGSNPKSYSSQDGSITISSYDVNAGTMEGTFNFTAGDFTGQDPASFEITNGAFEISF